MSLVEHAEREFSILYKDSKADELGQEMNSMMKENVIELLKVFGEQGHSGFSAS